MLDYEELPIVLGLKKGPETDIKPTSNRHQTDIKPTETDMETTARDVWRMGKVFGFQRTERRDQLSPERGEDTSEMFAFCLDADSLEGAPRSVRSWDHW